MSLINFPNITLNLLKHTVTGALGLLFAAIFAKTVSDLSQRSLFHLFSTLTALHIYANMKCMKLISFNYLNVPRMDLIIKVFFSGIDAKVQKNTGEVDALSPDSICRQEPLLFKIGSKIVSLNPYRIKIGVSFDEFWYIYTSNGGGFGPFIENVKRDGYCITMKHKCQVIGQCLKIYIILSNTATPLEKAKAYFHAHLLGNEFTKKRCGGKNQSKSYDASISESNYLENEAFTKLNILWQNFESTAKRTGWDLKKTDLQTEGFDVEIK